MGSDCNKAEATGRLNIGATYTFGGKKFVPASARVDKEAVNEEINKYRAELEDTRASLVETERALASAKENPIIKEVVKEKIVPGPRAIFFKIGSAKIDCYGMVDIRLAAEELKANPDKKYRVVGYADKATGSVQLNQTLTEKRAKAVYDALIAEGVNKDQVEYIGAGGTDNMFFDKDHLNRVVIMK